MSIELDWQVTEEGTPPPDDLAPVPASKPRRPRCVPRRVFITLGLILAAAIATVSLYVFAVYRKQVERAEREIRPIARQEAQAIVQGDRDSFLALQDPEDDNWRTMQAKYFGRLERDGLPEFGWKSTGVPPQPGKLTLEPGGARLDVMHQFSVTNPLPNGPASITLRVPQFYRQTPSGWVHANGTSEYWGTWRSHSGRHFAMRYTRRDADVLEPLIPRMDEMLARLCGPLPCPPQPIYVIFENSPDALTRLSDFSYGFDEGGFVLRLPSPHLTGVPTDARSRDELYRAIGTRIVQALATEAWSRRLSLNSFPTRLFLQWELSKAKLERPFITAEITRTLGSLMQTGEWQSLAAIPLRSRSAAIVTDEDVALTSLAFAFLEQEMDTGAVERLIPTMQFNATLGEIIRAVWKVNPLSLEPKWLAYLRQQAGLPLIWQLPPSGELALTCAMTRENSVLVSISVDGTRTRQVASGRSLSNATWSPDGKRLAYLRDGQIIILEADGQTIRTVTRGQPINVFGWIPDGQVWITTADEYYQVDPDTGTWGGIAGLEPVWSRDGKRMAYFNYIPIEDNSSSNRDNRVIQIAASDGSNAREIGVGYGAAWSPDNRRLAFSSGFPNRAAYTFLADRIQIADVVSGQVQTLISARELSQFTDRMPNIQWLGNLAWSPDGSMLAVSVKQAVSVYESGELALFVVNVNTGQVRAHWQGISAYWLSIAWSADSHYVGFWVFSDRSSRVSSVGTLNVATGQTVTLPGRDFDWSPDGQWLAVPQDPDGVLLVTPDLSAMRWLDAPNCFSVAWRPNH